MIGSFFTEAPRLVEVYYIIIVIALLGAGIYTFFPQKTALKLFIPHRLISHRSFVHKKEEKIYDWSTALKRQSLLLLFIAFLAIFILLLTSFYGQLVAKVGLAILATLTLIGGYWIDPTN